MVTKWFPKSFKLVTKYVIIDLVQKSKVILNRPSKGK